MPSASVESGLLRDLLHKEGGKRELLREGEAVAYVATGGSDRSGTRAVEEQYVSIGSLFHTCRPG